MIFRPSSHSKRALPRAAGSRFRGGMALVVTMALLVLITGLVLAFFSRATGFRQSGATSVGLQSAEWVANLAADYVLEEFLAEIRAGSLQDPLAGQAGVVPLYNPISVQLEEGGPWISPGVMPQRSGNNQGVDSVLKTSSRGIPFYDPGQPGYNADPAGPLPRAAAAGTGAASANGRSVARQQWLAPGLIPPGQSEAFTEPDWIYVARNGSIPGDFSGAALRQMVNPGADNDAHVVGRFAYVVYDLGDLVDVQVAGNLLEPEQNRRRGRLHQINPASAIPGVAADDFVEFVRWRSADFSTQGGEAAGGLFDPANTFCGIPEGGRGFAGRQDLVNYTRSEHALLPASSLPAVTSFSRAYGAPLFRPDPGRPQPATLQPPNPNAPDPAQINPNLAAVRFPMAATLRRDGYNAVTVPAGSSVLPRKFPLPKIDLLADPDAEPQAIEYYFGLRRRAEGHGFDYIAGIETPPGSQKFRLARLDEVAELGREPNFFELLQAVIYTGSLGKSGPNTYAYEETGPLGGPGPDTLQNLQVMRIGANIIDQWDGDDFPTRIDFPSGVAGDPFVVLGHENLPYISQVHVVAYRPPYALDRIQAWAAVDVWNPHQNAKTAPDGIEAFRILPVGGSPRFVGYYFPAFYPPGKASGGPPLINQHVQSVFTNYTNLWNFQGGRNLLTFAPGADYSQPVFLGGAAPDSESASAGILLIDGDAGAPAIPPRGARNSDLQAALNAHMWRASQFTWSQSPKGGSYGAWWGPIADGPAGEYRFPAGTTFENLDAEAWFREDIPESKDADGNLIPGEIRISANFGVKAHNSVRLEIHPTNPLRFDLQARIDGQWRTYQKLEGWFRASDGPHGQRDGTKALMLENTYHLEPQRNPLKGFYTWMARWGSCGMIRADPRTPRFGSSGINAWAENPPSNENLNSFAGFSVRSSSAEIPTIGATANVTDQIRRGEFWICGTGNHATGVTSGGVPGAGFERGLFFNNAPRTFPFGYVSNHPLRLDKNHPLRYTDPDGLIRPADGYFGGLPTVPLSEAYNPFPARPQILNRPFRSVGEMGYAFRDLPWKTLDFFTRRSADLGLLDAFSVAAPEEELPVVAGKINLNTANTALLAAVLEGALKQEEVTDGATGVLVQQATVGAAEAMDLAQALVTESAARPFLDVGEIVRRVLQPVDGSPSPLSDTLKAPREAPLRALAEIGDTRTWNFLIDLAAQAGNFAPGAATAADFLVTGQRRIWVHVAVDRITGRVIDQQLEVIHD